MDGSIFLPSKERKFLLQASRRDNLTGLRRFIVRDSLTYGNESPATQVMLFGDGGRFTFREGRREVGLRVYPLVIVW